MKKAISFILALITALTCSFNVFAKDLPIIPIGPQVKISGLSLVLSGEIGLVFHVEVPSDYADGYAILSCKDDEPLRLNIADCSKDGEGKYKMTYNLSSVRLADPVSVTVYSKGGTALAAKSKSAAEYAELMIADKNSSEKEIAVVKALINYGHYAQLACSRYCGWTVGTDCAEISAYSAPKAAKEVFDEYKIKWSGGDICDVALQLGLQYKTELIVYITAAAKPSVTVNGSAAEATLSSAGKYRLVIDGINAMKLGDEYEITVNDEMSLTVSAFTYGAFAMESASEDTKSALLAMYEFYKATCEYNGK